MKIRSNLHAGKKITACDIQLKNLQRAVDRGDCSAIGGYVSQPSYYDQQSSSPTYSPPAYYPPSQPVQGGGYYGGVYYADRSGTCG